MLLLCYWLRSLKKQTAHTSSRDHEHLQYDVFGQRRQYLDQETWPIMKQQISILSFRLCALNVHRLQFMSMLNIENSTGAQSVYELRKNITKFEDTKERHVLRTSETTSRTFDLMYLKSNAKNANRKPTLPTIMRNEIPTPALSGSPSTNRN